MYLDYFNTNWKDRVVGGVEGLQPAVLRACLVSNVGVLGRSPIEVQHALMWHLGWWMGTKQVCRW